MSKLDVVILSAIESNTRGICLDLIRENPALTVGELQELCRGEFGKFISTITIGELATGQAAAAPKAAAKPRPAKAPAKATAKPAKAKPAKPAKAKPAKAKPAAGEGTTEAPKAAPAAEVDTRTPAGRQAFDEAVFKAVQSIGSPAGAGDIQKLTGGTNMQVRTACNRLIEAGRLSWSGKARGTRYFVA